MKKHLRIITLSMLFGLLGCSGGIGVGNPGATSPQGSVSIGNALCDSLSKCDRYAKDCAKQIDAISGLPGQLGAPQFEYLPELQGALFAGTLFLDQEIFEKCLGKIRDNSCSDTLTLPSVCNQTIRN